MPLRDLDEDGNAGEEEHSQMEGEEDEEGYVEDEDVEEEIKKNNELLDELVRIESSPGRDQTSELETTQRLLAVWKEKLSREKARRERRRKEKKGRETQEGFKDRRSGRGGDSGERRGILRPRLGWGQLGKYGSLRLQATEILMRVRLLLHVDPRPAAGVYIHLTMLRCLYVLTTRKKELLPRIHEVRTKPPPPPSPFPLLE